MNRIWILAAVLLACGGSPEPGTTGSGTGTGTGTGGGTGTGTGGLGPEDCANGLDDDGDSLLDCEDEDCVGDPACVESDCFDDNDNDNDGAVDCWDEDCWGVGCAVARSRITSAGGINWREGSLDLVPTGNCSGYHIDTATIELASPAGSVEFLSAYGGSNWVTCNWSADRSVAIDLNHYGSPFAEPRPLVREGFTIDADCPLQYQPAFLPLVVTLDEQTDVRALRAGEGGPVWFGMTGNPSVSPPQNASGPFQGTNGCDFTLTGTLQSVTWSNADVGFDFAVWGHTLDSTSTTP